MAETRPLFDGALGELGGFQLDSMEESGTVAFVATAAFTITGSTAFRYLIGAAAAAAVLAGGLKLNHQLIGEM